MKTKTLLLTLVLISFGSSTSFAQSKQLTGDMVKVINELTFDHNTHHHKAFTQSHRIKSRNLGNVKKETIDYGEGYISVKEYLKSGEYKYIKHYKDDTLKHEYLYEYEGGKLVKEKGVYEVDYQYISNNEVIGINPGVGRKKFYRAKDTIFIKEKWRTYEVLRNMKNGNEWNERFLFKYNNSGDLEKIDIYYNHERSGVVINKYDSLGRVKEHHHIHDFSYFVQERVWQKNFRNSVYLFEYNDLDLIEKYRIEYYNGETREWEPTDIYINYEFLGTEIKPIVKVTMRKNGMIKTNRIAFDEQGNWLKQTEIVDGYTKIYQREIEYY